MSGVIKGIATLNRERAYTGNPVAREFGNDLQARLNAQYEMIFHKAAPGAGIRSIPGHTHRSDGNGVGIMRMCNGSIGRGTHTQAFTSATSPRSMGTAYGYQTDATTSKIIMGVIYVSPGIESVTFDVSIDVDSTIADEKFRIINITDSTGITEGDTVKTDWTSVSSTSPVWHHGGSGSSLLLAISRTEADRSIFKRVEIDIQASTDSAGSRTFNLYAVLPWEYQNADAGV